MRGLVGAKNGGSEAGVGMAGQESAGQGDMLYCPPPMKAAQSPNKPEESRRSTG